MSRTKGTYTLTSNIEPKVGAPLDARTVVKLKTDLTANNTFPYPYKGLTVFVEEESKKYTLIGADTTNIDNWIEEGSATTGGHTIVDPESTALTQRTNLQFLDANVTDDSTNDATVVENITVVNDESDITNAPDGIYMVDREETIDINADEVIYDNTDSGLQADNTQDAIDEVIASLGTAAYRDVPASGDAGFTQVVLGKDTRLTYYDRNRYDAQVKCSTNIVEGNIIVGLNGLYHHLNDGTVFDITYPILYAKNNMAAGAANKSNYDSLAIDITITQQMTLTQFLPVYIKGRLSGNVFNPISTTPLTQEIVQDGYHYMLLGLASTTTNIYLFHDHRIFAYNGGSFCELIGNIGTAAYRDVPASGDASVNQVVTGNDTRLSDARPASDVSAWAKESTKPTYTASEVGAIDATLKGVANGVAELDAAGKVPSSQLPSFVDDVIEVADYDHLPITGESGKIYVTLDTNKTYRWTGSGYAEISESLALGETSSTAYRGDRGKTAYDHSQDSGRITAAVSSGLYKFSATAEGHISGTDAVQKSDITALGIPGSDTNTTYTFAGGTNKITVTPSDGTAQDVAITVSDSTKLPLAGGDMTGASGIQFPTTAGNNKSGNWISAGGGYSTGSGKSGLKILACEQADCVSGLGQDCGGGPYELSIVTGASTAGDTRIRFLSHKVASPATYTQLAELQANGNFVCTSINGFTIGKSVPADAVFTDHTYNFGGTTFYSGNSGNAEHNANSIQYNGDYYYTSNGPATTKGASTTDGGLYAQFYSTTWGGQIAQDYRNGNLFVRGKNNGTLTEWSPIASGLKIAWGRYGTTNSTTKIKINIKPATSWMLCFVVTLYQGYRATKVMISGYNYSSNYWYSPVAKLLADSSNSTINVYFGYDSAWNLWVGFDGGSYTGVCISDVCNGYTQLTDLGEMFTISNVSSLTTLQTTTTATKPDAATVNGLTLSLVT